MAKTWICFLISALTGILVKGTKMESSNYSGFYESGMDDQYHDEDNNMYGNLSDYGPYDYYSEGDFVPHFYKVSAKWEIVIRGYITFFIALVVTVSNSFMVMVFLRRAIGSQTTFLLVALAISDALICFTRLPEAFYFNILENHEEYVPYRWCMANHVLYIIYQIFRVSSNWITALLGCQRCMSISMPMKFNQIWSMRNTLLALGTILLASILLNIYEMIAINISELKIYTTPDFNVSLPSGCLRSFSESLAKNVGDRKKSQMLFFIFSGLLYRILPVVILCVTTFVLALFLKKRARSLTPVISKKKKNKVEQYKRITLIIFIIMIVFLVAEIQDGIAYIIYAHELSTDKPGKILSEDADIMWDTVSSTISLLGYACNFWIFVLMSPQFRTALVEMFCRPFTRNKKAQTRIVLDSEGNLSNSTSGKTNSSTCNETTAV